MNKRHPQKKKHVNTGLSLPEVMIGSFILVLIVLNSVRMTTHAIGGMNKSKTRSLVDTAIARHIETLRKRTFEFLCIEGCKDNELTKALKYDLDNLKPLCDNVNIGLGKAFLDSLDAADMPKEFEIESVPPVTVRVSYVPEFNRLHVTYEADTKPSIVVPTTLVPHSQGWCP